MKKVIKAIKILLIILFFMTVIYVGISILNEKPSYADSGFSSNYDSDDSDSGGIIDILFMILYFVPEEYEPIVLLAIVGALIYSWFYSKKKQERKIKEERAIAERKITELIPSFNIEKFLMDGYTIFCNIQEAWSNFELEKVRYLIVDDLYQIYESKLAEKNSQGEQDIIKDFKLKQSFIKGVEERENTIFIKTIYTIEQYDYTIEKETHKVISGTKHMKQRTTYELEFRRTSIDEENGKWVLSNKEKTHQEVM